MGISFTEDRPTVFEKKRCQEISSDSTKPRRSVCAPTAVTNIADQLSEGDAPMSFLSWLRKRRGGGPGLGSRARGAPRKRAGFHPRFDALEERAQPSVLTVTNSFDSGGGSLRATIAAASSGDEIVFAKSVSAITLTSGEIAIDKSLDIQGPGNANLVISGSNARAFDISGSSTNVEIHDLTIANGVASGVTVTGLLGPATLGGGILDNQAHLLLSNVTVANCHASGVIGGGGGVASISGATLVVVGGTFTGNTVNGTSVDSPGGAILSDAGSTLSVQHSSFTGNRAIDGGAIGVWGGSQAAISTSTFTNNQCGSDIGSGTPSDNGGAIFADSESVVSSFAGSTLSVSYCSLANNTAHGADGGAGSAGVSGGNGGQGAGGAIGVGGVGTVANITYDAFTNNQAVGGSGGAGGAGANGGNGGPGSGGALSMADATLNLAHCNFTGNSATGGIGGTGGAGGNGGNGGIGRAGAYVHTVTFGTSTPVSHLSDDTMSNNVAMGGAGGAGVNGGNGGAGQGGAIRALLGTIDLSHCHLIGNDALGGVGGNASTGVGGSGGNGQGGAFLTAFGVTATIENSQLLSNLAEGGAGAAGGNGGNGLGGAIFNGGTSPFGTPHLSLQNSEILRNEADGGAAGTGGSDGVGIGGGVFNLGIFAYDATTVIAQNHASTSNDNIF